MILIIILNQYVELINIIRVFLPCTIRQSYFRNVKNNSTRYSFTYDGNGNQKSVAVGNNTLITNNYDNILGVLKDATYGNGNTVEYTYDNLNRVTSKTLDDKIS